MAGLRLPYISFLGPVSKLGTYAPSDLGRNTSTTAGMHEYKIGVDKWELRAQLSHLALLRLYVT